MLKSLLSGLAIALTFLAFWPYIRSILRGATKPHVFSWLIWGATTLVVFLAQLTAGGGAGAWPIGASGLVTLYVAFLAYVRTADRSVTAMDWWFLVMASASLPLWYVTADPLWAVVILTGVDLLGFGPTFRKAYHLPFEENLTFYALIAARNLISMAALAHYSLATILFPAVTGAACLLFITMVTWRRRAISPPP